MAIERRERLFWVDMEMTGLDPERDRVVEFAAIVTEIGDLKALDQYHAVIHQPAEIVDAAGLVVREMHARSGLWERVRASSTSVEDAEREALDLVMRWCGPQQAYLAGNSIWQDRRFLHAYMPRLEAYLHYRQVDVSTLKVLAGAWIGPAAIPAKADRHTALEDVQESIAELEHYRTLMVPARPTSRD